MILSQEIFDLWPNRHSENFSVPVFRGGTNLERIKTERCIIHMQCEKTNKGGNSNIANVSGVEFIDKHHSLINGR